MSCGGTMRTNRNAKCISEEVKTLNELLKEKGVKERMTVAVAQGQYHEIVAAEKEARGLTPGSRKDQGEIEALARQRLPQRLAEIVEARIASKNPEPLDAKEDVKSFDEPGQIVEDDASQSGFGDYAVGKAYSYRDTEALADGNFQSTTTSYFVESDTDDDEGQGPYSVIESVEVLTHSDPNDPGSSEISSEQTYNRIDPKKATGYETMAEAQADAEGCAKDSRKFSLEKPPIMYADEDWANEVAWETIPVSKRESFAWAVKSETLRFYVPATKDGTEDLGYADLDAASEAVSILHSLPQDSNNESVVESFQKSWLSDYMYADADEHPAVTLLEEWKANGPWRYRSKFFF